MIIKCWRRDNLNDSYIQDYKKYEMSLKDNVLCLLEIVAILLFFSYFFYRTVYPLISIFLIYPTYRKYKKDKLIQKRRQQLVVQFKDMLGSLSGSLYAGYSLENAVKEAYMDMVKLHGRESYIVKELVVIMKGVRNNQPVEKLFLSFGKRSGIDDIDSFSQVIAIGKRSGGNINRIIQEAIQNIEEKITVEQEIETMLQQKKYELTIMKGIPFVIIFYIEMTSKNYFNSMYGSLGGVLVMTVCLMVYLLAVKMANQIIEIRV